MENLTELKDNDLREKFAQSLTKDGGRWMPSNYLDELNRRAQNRLSKWLIVATAANAAAIIIDALFRRFC